MKSRIRKIVEIEAKKREWGAKTRFATNIGATPGLVGDWLAGRAEPGEDYRKLICKKYSISRDWLNTGEGPMLATEPPQSSGKVYSDGTGIGGEAQKGSEFVKEEKDMDDTRDYLLRKLMECDKEIARLKAELEKNKSSRAGTGTDGQ